MFLYIFIFCTAVTAGHTILEGKYIKIDYEDLRWPDIYKIQATKMSLTSGLVEDYSAWRTNDSSRVDHNKGAVKSIVLLNAEGKGNGTKFRIYPRNLDSPISILVCQETTQGFYSDVELEDILPYINNDNLQTVSNETLFDKETVKFLYSDSDNRDTIWAVQHETDYESVWVPVRYEAVIFNSQLGSIEKHEIWDFYNFETDFDDDVFNVDDYGCLDDSVEHITDSNMITNDLMFIDPENDDHVNHVFNAFKTKYNRHYVHHNEHALRRSIFQRNMRLISSKNKQNLGYKLAITKFADRTHEEMKQYKGLLKRPEGKVGSIPFPYNESQLKDMVSDLPNEYDLRIHGLVSSVKNQEDCGSCWAFATTSAVEGVLARINGGRLLSLSTQALVDCAWQFGAYGCGGGYDSVAYEWMMKYGLPTEEEYGPYTNEDGLCNILNMTTKYPIRGYTDVTSFSVGALKVALINHGPLSVTIEVTSAFSYYSSGIFYDQDCGTNVTDHEVSLVGYGQRDGEDFWILKNSWGTEWGEEGYMLISTRDNDCGVATQPTYVVF